MDNMQVARILENIADILELRNIPWKPQAYRNAARSIELLSEDIYEIYRRGEMEAIPGVGDKFDAASKESLQTGKLEYYEKLKKKIKIDIESLKNIPELGPTRIKLLYQKLKVKNLKDLEKALKARKIRELSGFGEKTEQLLLQGIIVLKTRRRFL